MRIYVGNLNYSTSAPQLRDAFAAIGPVKDAIVVTDRDTGRSKGFGFVEMTSDASARTAIERLNGTDLDGRPIRVGEAKQRAPRSAARRTVFGDDSVDWE